MTPSQIIEEAGIVSAIWVLACNDENPIITYKGIILRLSLSENYDIENVVKRHGELFRNGLPPKRLQDWKDEMLSGRRIPPLWILKIQDDDEKRRAIESISYDDVFRSQFRAGVTATRSPIEIIDWGLQHIERLRKGKIEAFEGKSQKWREIWIPLISVAASVFIAMGTIFVTTSITSYWQNENLKVQNQGLQLQKELKQLELSFKPKIESYVSFMDTINKGCDIAIKKSITSKSVTGNSFEIADHSSKIDTSFYAVEPFLDKDKSEEIERQVIRYKGVIADIYQTNKNSGNFQLNENVGKCVYISTQIKKILNKELFNTKNGKIE